MSLENVIIIGTGCAGLTAAIYTARANLKPLVLEGKQPGGQLTTTSEVENFPGFPEGVDGFELTHRMRQQAERFGARFESSQIEGVDFQHTVKKLFAGDRVYEAQAIIIATGASPRFLGVKGEQEFYGGKGVTTCATCDGAFYKDQVVAVIGGGDSACEEALFLTRFCSKVYLVHRRDVLRASPIMADRALKHPKIQPVWNVAVEEIIGSPEHGVEGLRLTSLKEGTASQTLACKGVFIAIGHIPNTHAFKGSLKLDEQGYIVPQGHSEVQTGVEGVFVAGDCSDHIYRQAITAAGMGCKAAIECERWLSEKA